MCIYILYMYMYIWMGKCFLKI